MEVNELKTKFEDLKKRLSAISTKITIAETKNETLTTRLKDEFGIKPCDIKKTLTSLKESIDNTKLIAEKTLTDLESKIDEVEKTIDV